MAGPRSKNRKCEGATSGMFAGIGGIELGLERAGFRTVDLCEKDGFARHVLAHRMPTACLRQDITRIKRLPRVSVLAAGFPCQDLSQAGRMAGVRGARFKLIDHVFRLLEGAQHEPEWLLLENVPFMLSLNRGEAMRYLARRFGQGGWRWAYRTVDARAFGIPQRRRRVLILASRRHDPRYPLLGEDVGERESAARPGAYGFYWTEGRGGLGLADDAIPPLKGGFGLGIPSAPAVWIPKAPVGRQFVIPDIRDLERLQGLPVGWTSPAERLPKGERVRWRLVSNAVCTPVSNWVGTRLTSNTQPEIAEAGRIGSKSWPAAGWGEGRRRIAVEVSPFPCQRKVKPIRDFLKYPGAPLSHRATKGFRGRVDKSSLRLPDGMYEALAAHEASFS